MERDAESVMARVEEMKARCRDLRMNVTPQRIAVYRALLTSEDHPTPEALYASVSREMPSISLATIYKALEALKKLGVCREISRLGEARRFDANLDHHHHLVCTACGAVMDFQARRFGALRPPEGMDGFIPSEVTVQVLGRCARCAVLESPEDEI